MATDLLVTRFQHAVADVDAAARALCAAVERFDAPSPPRPRLSVVENDEPVPAGDDEDYMDDDACPVGTANAHSAARAAQAAERRE